MRYTGTTGRRSAALHEELYVSNPEASRFYRLREIVGAWGVAALAVLAVILFGFGVWAVKVWIAPLTGSGNVHRDQNSAKNREHWSTVYNGDHNAVLADRAQVQIIGDSYRSTGSVQDRIDLTGAKLNCTNDVAKYNADAQNLLGAQFLPSGFPTSLDPIEQCGLPVPPIGTPGDVAPAQSAAPRP